jgi:hypothetical protein
MRDAVLDRHASHLDGRRKVCRAIVQPGEKMVMEIDHGSESSTVYCGR